MHTQLNKTRHRRTDVLYAGIGNAIELYDWLIFAAFSPYFADRIFPPGNHGISLLAVFATFAVSFFFRPLGGIVIGRFADHRGRKAALMLSVAMMAGGSWAIALLPSYDAVGILAPVGLLAARVVQGIAVGGETSSAASYVVEVAAPHRRGRVGAGFYISAGVASLLAGLTGVVITGLLNDAQLSDWGWRIPFVIGGILGLAILLLRRNMVESALFLTRQAREREDPTSMTRREHLRQGLTVLGVCAGGSLAYYTVFSALSPVLISGHGAQANHTFIALTIGTVVYTALLYPFGILSDTIGRQRQLMLFSVVAACLLLGLNPFAGPELWRLVALFSLSGAVVAIFSAQNTVLTAELFPTAVRATSLGLWLNLCAAVFGGTAPFILQAMTKIGHPGLFYCYGAVMCLVGLFAAQNVRDCRGVALT